MELQASLMKLIKFKNGSYPFFQAEGYASKFAAPYALQICKGNGYDIGCCKREWSIPGSIPIDIDFEDEYHALNLPYKDIDYIFSSHCLEHIEDWIKAMDYWYETLKKGGILFLYLPHYDQEYWRPWNNRKHKHVFTAQMIKDYMKDRGYINIFHSERDLNDSFMIFGEKQ